MIYTTLHRKINVEQHEPKHVGELRYPGRVGIFCSTSGICRVTLVSNPLIRHE